MAARGTLIVKTLLPEFISSGEGALALLGRLYDTVLLCNREGEVIEELGLASGISNVLEESRLESLRERLAKLFAEGAPFEGVVAIAGGDAQRVRGIVLEPPVNGADFCVVFRHPINLLPRSPSAMRAAEYEFVIQNMRQGLWRVNTKGAVDFANDYLAKWLETTPEEMVGLPVANFLADGDSPVNARSEKAINFEAEFITATGVRRRAIVSSCPIVTPKGRVDGEIHVITDITAVHAIRTKLVEEVQQMSKLANTDPLTGLSNRMVFDRTLKHLREKSEPFALIAVDLDGFKEINDMRGHACGDQVLIECGRRLKAAMRDYDSVVRLGGDEFVVLLPGTTKETTQEIVKRLVERLNFELDWEGQPVSVGASIGTAHSDDGMDAIARKADRMMYSHKRRRKRKQV